VIISGKPEDFYKRIKADDQLSTHLNPNSAGKMCSFQTGPYSRELKDFIDMYEFSSFEEAYHQLMNE